MPFSKCKYSETGAYIVTISENPSYTITITDASSGITIRTVYQNSNEPTNIVRTAVGIFMNSSN